MSDTMELNERARYFLKILIERYIRDGQPVGSRTLAKDAQLELSPATIRNVMADLEDLGLVRSPHTSAGRVPTVRGYRFFVDSLMSVKPVTEEMIQSLQQELSRDEVPHHLIQSASKLLSNMTHMAAMVMTPRHDQITVKELQFIPLSEKRILAILVSHKGEVFNQIIETARSFKRRELERAAQLINQYYSGLALETMKAKIIAEMDQHQRDMDRLMKEALTIAGQALQTEAAEKEELVLSGELHLMDFDELAHLDRIKELFRAFSEKQEIFHLLDRCSQANGVQIFIGQESGYEVLDQCTVITAPYKNEQGQVLGVLGVIGPTRMPYDRVIPMVDITARLLGSALKSI